MSNFAVIIPAYRPETALLDVIGALSAGAIPAIVVVDDGSGADFRDIFRQAAEFPKVRLVRHAVNLGKGAALKTGINHAMVAFPELQGVITADADGQHDPGDIQRVADALAAEPDRMILGVRAFGEQVPLRSRLGNVITREVMRALVGQNVSDTQTGLRGIPAALLPHLLKVEANGYDFELDMLIAVRQRAISITEVPIRTIYEQGNRTSHFNPLIDSMKIYFVLLRFSSLSLMTAALDSLVFYLAYKRLGNLAFSQVIGRLVAVAFNYSMVRRAVFYSKLRHATVLPKYLLLVCLSGTASYAGIQLLSARFHIQAFPAKLLVETLLFFANFAIQRDFIFGKAPPEGRPEAAEPGTAEAAGHAVQPVEAHASTNRFLTAVLAAAAIALVAVLYYGFRTYHMDAGWTPQGQRRFIHYACVFGVVSLGLLTTAPRAFPLIAALGALVVMIAAIGPLAVLAVAGFLISSCALGSILLGRRKDAGAEIQLCATLLGMAVYIFLMTFLARLPVNYPAVYAGWLVAPVLVDLRGTGRRMASWGRALVRPLASPWQGPAFALLMFVLGVHLIVVPQPEASADGLAMHLAIPVNISIHHMLTYRPDRILWSVMPMGADWCYAMVYLLGGEFAARLLNFAMFLLVEGLLYRLARRWVTPALGCLILALFASTSIVQLITGSLLVENFQAAMILGSLLAVWRFGESGERRLLYAAAVLGGSALAIKLGGMAYLVVTLPLAVIEIRRQWQRLGPRPALVCTLALVLVLTAALPSYAISWRLTGDPVFPFLNQAFPSPILDHTVSFNDPRFKQPIALRTPFDMTFQTSHYFEGRAGSLGFAYLLLAPLGLIGLLAVRRRVTVSAAVIAIVAALFILDTVPNARYLYPSLPLLLAPFAALLGWLAPGALRRALIALAVGCVVLNAWFLPSSNYYHGEFYEQSPLSAAGRRTYLHNHSPMREIGQYMNRAHPGAPVFLVEGSDLSAFNAEVYSNGWHQYNAFTRMQQARSPRDVLGILDQWNVHYVAAPKPISGVPIRPAVLAEMLKQCGTPEFQTTFIYLARVESDCKPAGGIYDDYNPAIVFQGRWSQNPGFAETYGHTITYSNLPGSLIRFEFQGNSLTYVYTKAVNRGKAAVVIDGVQKAVLDLYSPRTEWQSRTTFENLGSGQHTVLITLLKEKNPKATDPFIDLDAFEVR